MNKPPAFQFYVKDWRSSPTVLMMDDHEKAVFIDMLVASWESDEQGTLPLPLETSAKVCGRNVRSLKSFLRKFPQTFVEVSGKLVNQKLYDQGLTYRNLSIKRREAAKEGRANAQHLLHSASASASASATTKEREVKGYCAPKSGARLIVTSQFEIFWNAYPRKEGKKAAIRTWVRMGLDNRLGEILGGLKAWECARDPTYMPYAQGWLNAESWKERPLIPVEKKGGIDESELERIRSLRR